MTDVSHELHTSLEPRPNHKRSMIEARRMQPEDQTMGDAFEMLIYSHRWGHEDRYTLTRNEQG
ncbi:hypothetical protein ACTFRF_21440 [Bacillus cereus group sp. MYBK223-2]|uniref:hypothetical protein n=1 Tax=unclassified Bacillus cereus group TaxID=2750818 RepID=UPI003F79D920